MFATCTLFARCRTATVWIVTAAMIASGAVSFARPGGAGRGPGGPGPSRPAPGGNSRPGPGPGRPDSGVPGQPGGAGRVVEGNAPGAARPGGADVEGFLGAKPAAGVATRPVDPATAKSRAQSLQSSLQGRTQPFTSAWYAEHPGAWQYTHPYAEWWAIAGVVGLSNWLGYGVSPATATATTSAATASDEQAATAPPADLEWLPLGVYATSPQGAGQAHVYQQLAVSKKGELKGNYYDSISNAVQPISGSIDRETRKATWSIGTKGGATFETTLDALVKTPSSVTMKSGGSVQEWELVQMEKPAAKSAQP